MPSSLGGFAEGFLGRVDKYRDEEREDELRRTQREGQILSLLLEHGKPDVQALALQGLLDQANPKMRKKGLAGFLGQYQTGPAAGQLLSLLQTPERVERQVPTDQFESAAQPLQPQLTPPPMPGQNPEETATPLQFRGTPPPMRTEVTTRPRSAIYTPEERAVQQARGRAQGTYEGEYQGLIAAGHTPEEARALIKARMSRSYRGGAGTTQARAVELPDGTQTMAIFDPASARFYDPDTGQPLVDAMPLQRTGSASMGADRDSLSIEMFGKKASQLDSGQMTAVNQELIKRGGQAAYEKGIARGAAGADVPLNTQQRFQAVTGLQDDWRKVVAPVREMQRQFGLMQVGLQRYNQDRIGGSQAVLVTFQKILDPQSVVRESEYARSGSGLSLLDRLQGMYDKYIGQYDPVTQRWVGGGAGVPEAELKEMVETARQLVDNAAPWAEGERQRIEATARDFGLDPVRITGTPGGSSGAAPPPMRPPGGGAVTAPAGPAATAAPSRTVTEAELRATAGSMVPPVPPEVLRQKLVAAGYTIVP
jgi:hypothetical protein